MTTTFLFNTICDDLIEKITKDIKWFKSIVKNKKKINYIAYNRLSFINEPPRLTYYLTVFYKDYENNPNDYFTNSKETNEYRRRLFSSKKNRKYIKDKKGLLNYNYDNKKFKEIKY